MSDAELTISQLSVAIDALLFPSLHAAITSREANDFVLRLAAEKSCFFAAFAVLVRPRPPHFSHQTGCSLASLPTSTYSDVDLESTYTATFRHFAANLLADKISRHWRQLSTEEHASMSAALLTFVCGTAVPNSGEGIGVMEGHVEACATMPNLRPFVECVLTTMATIALRVPAVLHAWVSTLEAKIAVLSLAITTSSTQHSSTIHSTQWSAEFGFIVDSITALITVFDTPALSSMKNTDENVEVGKVLSHLQINLSQAIEQVTWPLLATLTTSIPRLQLARRLLRFISVAVHVDGTGLAKFASSSSVAYGVLAVGLASVPITWLGGDSEVVLQVLRTLGVSTTAIEAAGCLYAAVNEIGNTTTTGARNNEAWFIFESAHQAAQALLHNRTFPHTTAATAAILSLQKALSPFAIHLARVSASLAEFELCQERHSYTKELLITLASTCEDSFNPSDDHIRTTLVANAVSTGDELIFYNAILALQSLRPRSALLLTTDLWVDSSSEGQLTEVKRHALLRLLAIILRHSLLGTTTPTSLAAASNAEAAANAASPAGLTSSPEYLMSSVIAEAQAMSASGGTSDWDEEAWTDEQEDLFEWRDPRRGSDDLLAGLADSLGASYLFSLEPLLSQFIASPHCWQLLDVLLFALRIPPAGTIRSILKHQTHPNTYNRLLSFLLRTAQVTIAFLADSTPGVQTYGAALPSCLVGDGILGVRSADVVQPNVLLQLLHESAARYLGGLSAILTSSATQLSTCISTATPGSAMSEVDSLLGTTRQQRFAQALQFSLLGAFASKTICLNSASGNGSMGSSGEDGLVNLGQRDAARALAAAETFQLLTLSGQSLLVSLKETSVSSGLQSSDICLLEDCVHIFTSLYRPDRLSVDALRVLVIAHTRAIMRLPTGDAQYSALSAFLQPVSTGLASFPTQSVEGLSFYSFASLLSHLTYLDQTIRYSDTIRTLADGRSTLLPIVISLWPGLMSLYSALAEHVVARPVIIRLFGLFGRILTTLRESAATEAGAVASLVVGALRSFSGHSAAALELATTLVDYGTNYLTTTRQDPPPQLLRDLFAEVVILITSAPFEDISALSPTIRNSSFGNRYEVETYGSFFQFVYRCLLSARRLLIDAPEQSIPHIMRLSINLMNSCFEDAILHSVYFTIQCLFAPASLTLREYGPSSQVSLLSVAEPFVPALLFETFSQLVSGRISATLIPRLTDVIVGILQACADLNSTATSDLLSAICGVPSQNDPQGSNGVLSIEAIPPIYRSIISTALLHNSQYNPIQAKSLLTDIHSVASGSMSADLFSTYNEKSQEISHLDDDDCVIVLE